MHLGTLLLSHASFLAANTAQTALQIGLFLAQNSMVTSEIAWGLLRNVLSSLVGGTLNISGLTLGATMAGLALAADQAVQGMCMSAGLGRLIGSSALGATGVCMYVNELFVCEFVFAAVNEAVKGTCMPAGFGGALVCMYVMPMVHSCNVYANTCVHTMRYSHFNCLRS